ncbi:hypothetical protein ASPWEDRAFT_27965 [Aspergillus wentii DTO 134E9]|uniref:BHLH domain-containing protein n=1 Tax=Aspergillus wentii DTO 134E9 TaxID=1073089 RepID=A0A1L9RKE4_ASPWE|nr:uncharacterized protein ASPWEDRAFT_27965 [Aspergillus wentii DTO 134E9]KAI9923485.1 hypothetical protein MW887_008647 [Aspergillus wentii]OJJ35318.1 hypothetical protein ASPWEDRAFT_27965 [Aspergillus wentii DTO 134E9]
MSRSRLPPTPAMSGEFIIKEQTFAEGTDCFALPPAALSPSKIEPASRRSSKSDPSSYFPASPTSPDLVALGRTANPRSSATKRPLEDFDLPPPPTRTRKIIQMKPKTQPPPKPAATATKSAKETGKAPANNGPASANSKKKQPSATSAAGRKIARKTAHSLIERRRRSKMNEEFSTLKDMIPACRGQEMHKLAILQASIDYVNYLEQCVQDLKVAGGKRIAVPPRMPPAPPSPTSPEFLAPDDLHSASASPELLPESAQVNDTSPSFSPRTQVPSAGPNFEFTHTSLPSPVLGPPASAGTQIHFSPQQWPTSANTSPAILPRQSNASAYSADAEIDHEASAALLMLNRDRRGTADSINTKLTNSTLASQEDRNREMQETQRRMGMSVKDLLIS